MTKIIKLDQNENAYGAPPKALKAIEEFHKSVYIYPDNLHRALKKRLAEKHKITPNKLVISAGSVALMDMSIKTFVNFDENIVVPEVTFVGYKYMAKVNRRACKMAPLKNNRIDLKKIITLCDQKTRIVFLANPNNPTGTMITHVELKKFLLELPSSVYVVSDEAYSDYITDPNYPDTLKLQEQFPNLIIFRTFSKIYGLAGLRVGYAIAHTNAAQALTQCRTPFSINSLASTAALAALEDDEFIKRCADVNAVERKFLFEEFIKLGLNATKPTGNFIFVEFDKISERDKIFNLLENKGIIARKMGPFGRDLAFRISVGRPEENLTVIECLKAM